MNASPSFEAIPLRADSGALLASERRTTLRAVTALVLAAKRNASAESILKAAWPDDRRALAVLRAVVSPLSTAQMTGDFPPLDVIGLFRSLAPTSAALALLGRGRMVDLTGLTSVAVPSVASVPQAPFVAEGEPGPVVNLDFGALKIGPTRKVLIMAAVSAELENASPQGAVNIVGAILSDAVGKSLDAAAFGDSAVSAIAPPGLLHGVAPIAASGVASAMDALTDDLGNLVQAISDAGIDTNNVVFVAGPKEAVTLKIWVGGQFDYPILSSNALKGSVAAFAAGALATAYQDGPQIETSNQAVLHFEDSDPQPILAASPTRSAFQEDLIAVKVRGRAAWGVEPGGVQIVRDVSW
jgi:hypothetical protein